MTWTIMDREYARLLEEVLVYGDELDSRNGPVKTLWESRPVDIDRTPLITVRKTAWNKALREMEWFLSGEPCCPDDLRDWWQGQLSPQSHCYFNGYGEQLRDFGQGYDQVQALIEGLRNHPHSRRLIMTTWHPQEMADITHTNNNPKTPTTCHGSFIQCFVRDEMLFMTHYQRSADLLLGYPHNLIQYWALLLWLAHHAGLTAGGVRYILGDAHIYCEPTHLNAATEIITAQREPPCDDDRYPELIYQPVIDEWVERPVFRAADFLMCGTVADPVTHVRPVLLA